MATHRTYDSRKVLFGSILIMIFSCLFLLILRMVLTSSQRYSFLIWNLLLSIVPLIFAYRLNYSLKTSSWKNWPNIFYSIVWLAFLPNSFYMITDLIHIQSTGDINILFDAILVLDFVIAGLIFGFLSLLIIHKNLEKKIAHQYAHLLVFSIILISSFAIYLGRYLRWNSWDIATNPAGLIYDVTNKFINPFSNIQTFGITLTIFIFLTSVYFFIYSSVKYLKDR